MHFTGYYEPVYAASRVRTAEYRYPIYREPRNFAAWPSPQPTRLELEGSDGLQQSPRLRGCELAWLRDRLAAYLVQVEGSARLWLTEGRMMSIGYSNHTAWPYVSIGRELVRDHKIRFEELTQQALVHYFQATPADLNRYLPRNRRFVFFHETHGAPAGGSLGMPLTAEHSVAVDLSIMPPGALALAQFDLANPVAIKVLGASHIARFVLAQDSGSAIIGPERVDLFMGSGPQAGERSGVINARGQLYFLLLGRL